MDEKKASSYRMPDPWPHGVPVALLKQKQAPVSVWALEREVVVEVLPDREDLPEMGKEASWQKGFVLTLYPDELESYYYNILSDTPRLFIVSETDQEPVKITKVTACPDEVNALMEVEDYQIEAVSIVPEIYQWLECYVLTHYVPERRQKRKRVNWSKS